MVRATLVDQLEKILSVILD